MRGSQWEAAERAVNREGGRRLPGGLNAEERKRRLSGAEGAGGRAGPQVGPQVGL